METYSLFTLRGQRRPLRVCHWDGNPKDYPSELDELWEVGGRGGNISDRGKSIRKENSLECLIKERRILRLKAKELSGV